MLTTLAHKYNLRIKKFILFIFIIINFNLLLVKPTKEIPVMRMTVGIGRKQQQEEKNQ